MQTPKTKEMTADVGYGFVQELAADGTLPRIWRGLVHFLWLEPVNIWCFYSRYPKAGAQIET